MKKDKTGESIEFKFTNPYTNEEEEYDYYLDFEDMVKAIRLYADYHDVTLDGTDTHVWNLFVDLDSGRYEHINEIFEKILECDFVKEKISEDEAIIEKAKEEFEEEKDELQELEDEEQAIQDTED